MRSRIGQYTQILVVAPLAFLMVAASGCGSLRSDEPAGAEQQYQSLDESCGAEDDFTARSVLNGLADQYGAQLYYPEREDVTTVYVRPNYRNGTVECLPGERDSAASSARLSIEIELEVETDDGMFRESFPGTVSGYADSDEFRVSGSTALDRLDGSYRPQGASEPEGRLLVEGWLTLESHVSQGAIRIGPTSDSGRRDPTVAIWNRGEHVLTESRQPCGFSSDLTRRRFLDRLEGRRSGRFEFTGRAVQPQLDVRFDHAGDQVVCVPAESAADGEAYVRTDLVVRFVTGDGALDELFDGSARLAADGTLDVVASSTVGAGDGTYWSELDVPPETRVRLRGTADADRRTARGAVRLETPEGENPLGVPTLGTWRAGFDRRPGAPE